LLVADHFGRYGVDSARNIAGSDTGFVFGKRFNKKGVSSRITSGILLNTPLDKAGKFLLSTGFYYQAGKDPDALRLKAYTLTLSLAHSVGKLSYTMVGTFFPATMLFPPPRSISGLIHCMAHLINFGAVWTISTPEPAHRQED
jgi:hypothetical protein